MPSPHNSQEAFLTYLSKENSPLLITYQKALDNPDALTPLEESDLIITLAPYVENFIGILFGISDTVQILQKNHRDLAVIFYIKREFVQRHALKKITILPDAYTPDFDYPLENFDFRFSHDVYTALQDEKNNEALLERAAYYAFWAISSKEGRGKHDQSVLFQKPNKIDYLNLLQEPNTPKITRDGFHLTDHGFSCEKSLSEAHYCIHCHKQDKDSCSKGYKKKSLQTVNKHGDSDILNHLPLSHFMENSLGISLQGCPLNQKISEMNHVKSQGYTIGALAIAMIDNPLLAATGHRICNDCMKACIFQKQDPVNIPGTETEILKSVLDLPKGMDLYDTLSRWNPLNIRRPIPRASTGRKILVVGAGPAGFSLSYHLLQEGHTVVLIDGTKIEPGPDHWPYKKNDPQNIPMRENGDISQHHLIEESPLPSWSDFCDNLDARIIDGFGGVMEYGITVRWDKNYLKLIRLILERHDHFMLLGGVRFGGTLTSIQAFDDLGFDHIALCMGAGKPNLLPLPHGLAKGVRYASDFLMTLQLSGAFQKDTLVNLDIRFPVVVIGGGLTSIDTATEVLAYYPRYIEKMMDRFLKLPQEKQKAFKERLDFIDLQRHHLLFQNERVLAHNENRVVNFLPILNQLGGVTLLYRKNLTASPAYRLNHEEVQHALNQGVKIIDQSIPLRIDVNEKGEASGLTLLRNGKEESIQARTILIAAGTQPNTNLMHDEPNLFSLDDQWFKFQNSTVEKRGKTDDKNAPDKNSFIIHQRPDSKSITMFGDMHPKFAGNVVKAMASAKMGYPVITDLLKDLPPHVDDSSVFLSRIKDLLTPSIVSVNRLTSSVVELIVKAPFAAHNTKPGQFFRFQTFQRHQEKWGIPMVKPLPLTGYQVNHEKGTISLVVLEHGASSKICQYLKPGTAICLMGPTGEPSFIPSHKNVLLIGGGLGNVVLYAISKAMREQGCHVIYFAGYRSPHDVFNQDLLEQSTDHIVWCSDSDRIESNRDQDISFQGNLIKALEAYEQGAMENLLPLNAIDHVLLIGSEGLTAAISKLFKTTLAPHLKSTIELFAGINSPMQCMMKGVCGQCIQRLVDPKTGQQTFVFSCAHQDQSLMDIDFETLKGRLSQNLLGEALI